MTHTAAAETLPPGFHYPILIEGTQIGSCRGAIELADEVKLWFPTQASVTAGHYMPLKIGPVDGREPVTTMCRVARVEERGDTLGVHISLSNTNDKLLNAIARWFPHRPPPSTSEALDEGGAAEIDLSDFAEPLSQPQIGAVNSEVLRFQHDSLLVEADQLEATGQHAEAFKRVKKALELYPVNAEDLHIRLAKLAMASNQLSVALEHAQSAKQLNPSRRDAERLVRSIHGERSTQSLNRDTQRLKKELRSQRFETLKAVAVVVFVILPALAYNVWAYVLPHGPRPEPLDASQFTEIVSTDKVVSLDKILYVFVDDSWFAIDKKEKTRILAELDDRANLITAAERIVVTTHEPRLLAIRYKGRTKIYR